MAEETTYLELSEAGNGAHKFYEVVTDGTQVRIRYGRIGDQGQSQISNHETTEKAHKFAQKKLREKLSKGYERATIGQRQKRSVTRRAIVSTRSTARQSPVLWKFASGSPAFGIFVDEKRCWVGNQAGQVFGLDHTGQVQAQYRLPDGVKCLVADDIWLYAGCDDGNVYDLSGKIPRVAYQIAPDVDIYWLDIRQGALAVSDAVGRVALVNHEDESEWLKSTQYNAGWMVRCGEEGIYHGHSGGVTMYNNLDGSLIWQQRTRGSVLFGWQEETMVYAGTSDNRVYSFTKQGQPGPIYDCDTAVFSCATAEQGKYVFAGDSSSSIYCFDQDGRRLWKLGTGCGTAYSMQYFNDHLYIVTTEGALACIDVSEAAIQAAQAGTLPQAVNLKAPPVVASLSPTTLETATDDTQGIVLECFREGGKLRMRVISPGYNPDLRVQFPQNIREEHARYLVDEVRLTAQGDFYRVYGNITKLVNQPQNAATLRQIAAYRTANRWFDQGDFNDLPLVQNSNLSISTFLVRAGNIVDGIQALYGEQAITLAPPHGNLKEGSIRITLEPGDRWSKISGFYGDWFAGLYVVQLTFHTREGRTYGPFGDMGYATNIQPFSLVIQPDESIIALSGVVSFGDNGRNRHLGALGLVLRKDEPSSR